jgi:hypothetical protein
MKITGPGLILLIILSVLFKPGASQDQVDIGIFESEDPDTLVIKCRPNYNLASPWAITNIAFTIKWPDTSDVTDLIVITSTVNSFFNLQPQQVAYDEGYIYIVYAMVGTKYVTWAAGMEYPVLELLVNEPGGDCTEFEISNDAFTLNNLNGGYWFESLGFDRTGIIYQQTASLSTAGGDVSADEEICLGSSTSVMTLTGYAGDVLTWQKKHDAFAWTDISGTAGLTEYSATPDSSGTYLYRAKVQRGTCSVEFSTPAAITVRGYSEWTGAADTDWSNINNWNVCGVPDINRDVVIPQVPTDLYPVIDISASCNTIIIRNGATVTVTASGSLDIQSSGP